jgi:hypothetical protein
LYQETCSNVALSCQKTAKHAAYFEDNDDDSDDNICSSGDNGGGINRIITASTLKTVIILWSYLALYFLRPSSGTVVILLVTRSSWRSYIKMLQIRRSTD